MRRLSPELLELGEYSRPRDCDAAGTLQTRTSAPAFAAEISNSSPVRGGRDVVSLRLMGVTARQLDCLRWVREGKSATDVGAILGISGRTVEGHLAKICEHLGVRTRLQAVLKALELGLIHPPAP